MANSFTQFNVREHLPVGSVPLTDVSPIAFEALSPNEQKDFRLQLFSQVQTTLDIERVVNLLLRQLKQVMPISGIQYSHATRMLDLLAGQMSRHRCHYQLAMHNEQFGDISFLRNKRFSEQEMLFIESIMDIIIFPLRNALKYQDALATAMIDPLTGLNNRGAMAVTLNREMERARRHENQKVSVLMIDIDHFKGINDRYGHLIGDDILRQTAHYIQNSIRGSDACFRYGGEEFLICLTNSSLALAQTVAERIRVSVEEKIHLPDKEKPVTASVGIAHYSHESDWPALVARADKALYSAKKQGRNRVVASTTSNNRFA